MIFAEDAFNNTIDTHSPGMYAFNQGVVKNPVMIILMNCFKLFVSVLSSVKSFGSEIANMNIESNKNLGLVVQFSY